MSKSKSKISRNQVLIGITALSVIVLGVFIGVYNFFKHNNVPISEEYYLYIHHNATYRDVLDSLQAHGCIVDSTFFNWLANRKEYPQNIKAGRYKVVPNMSVNTLLNHLCSGNQDPMKVVIGKFRSKEKMAQLLSRKLDFDSADFMKALTDSSLLDTMGLTQETALALFIPNTYEVYWNITPEEFLWRMYKEKESFWNKKNRRDKAEKMNMTELEVVILASIVDEETNKNDEKPLVASVYLNRLRRGYLLQADPTVRFAINDFSIRRVLRKHLRYDNPYNTYIYKGLPPGPICIPSIASIDAVLEDKQTKYMFFCAKEDFSGYHNFAISHAEHVQNARKFQKALNERKIFK